MEEKLATPPEVAAYLGITPKALAARRNRGQGPAYLRLGHRTIRYRWEDVEAWIQEHAEAA